MKCSHCFAVAVILVSCSVKSVPETSKSITQDKLRLIIDTDANNELDDQHALAYAFSSQDSFSIEGVTVNNTRVGNGIQGQYDEAMRILHLFNEQDNIPIYKGASATYSEILPHINDSTFDGKEAVDFIINQAMSAGDDKLILLPIGKLTNIALALKIAPEIKDRVRIVWLGSNYPDPGEYNLENDTTAVNPVIASGVHLEMVVVRYGKATGSHAVAVSKELINQKMKGLGPVATTAVTGRHGGTFRNFGDYSVDLFDHIDLQGDPPSRALYDMVAVAILKNPEWGLRAGIPPTRLEGYEWKESYSQGQNVSVWENFDREKILADFFASLARSGND